MLFNVKMIFLKRFKKYVTCRYPYYHKGMKQFYTNCIQGHDYGYSLFNYGKYFHIITLAIHSKIRQEIEITICKTIRKLEFTNHNSILTMVADDNIDDICIVYIETKDQNVKDYNTVRLEIRFNMCELYQYV